MKRRLVFISFAVFLLAALLYFFYPTDQNRIRTTIRKCVKAIEAEDIDLFMKNVSYTYYDTYGNSYLTLKKNLEKAFQRLDAIGVEKNIRRITVTENSAEAEIHVRVIAGRAPRGTGEHEIDREYIIGDAVNAEPLFVYFEKATYSWLITQVKGEAGSYRR